MLLEFKTPPGRYNKFQVKYAMERVLNVKSFLYLSSYMVYVNND